jgi:glycosyltransferase involved in cell wall biosynthesis
MNTTSIRFVIPAKNEALLLPRLLDSLEKQVTRHVWKVVVADANSLDKTREIATTHGATVVKGGMPGPGRNAGQKMRPKNGSGLSMPMACFRRWTRLSAR